MGELTFNQLRREVAQDATPDPSAHLLLLQSAAGELAEVLRWRGVGQGWSELDGRRLAGGLGGVVLAAARLAEATGVDLAAATSARVQRDARRRALQSGSASVPPPPPPVRAHPPQPQPAPQQPPPQPNPPQHLVPQAQCGAPSQVTPPRAQQNGGGAALTTTIPQSTEIAPVPVPNGFGSGVNSRQRPAAVPQRSGARVPPGLEQTGRRPSFKRSLSVVVPRTQMPGANNPDLYSPTHFQVDLFAPVTRQTDFEVEYGAAAPVVPATLSQRTHPTQELAPLSPRTLKEDFFPMVEALQGQVFAPEEFDALDLTFCVPEPDGRITDLIPNGRHVKVTLSTRDEFVKLAMEWRDKKQRGGGSVSSSSPPPSARGAMPAPLRTGGKRPSLKRTLTVQLPKKEWDPERVRGLFSPTHFQHDLFSPYSASKDINVDYGAGGAEVCLPRSLSKPQLRTGSDAASLPPVAGSDAGLRPKPSPSGVRPRSPGRRLTPVHSASSFRRRSFVSGASADDEDEEEYKGLDLLCEVADEIAEERALMERELEEMIETLEGMCAPDATEKMDAKDLEEMGLTFSIQYGGEVHNLLPGGSDTPVTVERLPEFIELAKDKLRQLQAPEVD
eukprot:Hpha_TRINITY_DN15042_c3_g11::TRINITY_DN15042_c3_g11_i1::g.125759::m.125759